MIQVEKMYLDGLQVMQKTPWIMLGSVNGVACSVDSLSDLDQYDVGWDSTPSDFGPVIVIAGIDTEAVRSDQKKSLLVETCKQHSL